MPKKKNIKQKSESLSECKLYVEGMHCSSCELLVEKKLSKVKGVLEVDADLTDKSLIIKSEDKPDLNILNKELEGLGYKVVNKLNSKEEIDNPFISIQDGQIKIRPSKFWDFAKNLLIFVNVFLVLYIISKIPVKPGLLVDKNSSLIGFFVFGIVAGMSSCAALVGGLLLSMVKQWNDAYIDSDSQIKKAIPHLLFHTGRILSFGILGGVLAVLGKSLTLGNETFFSVLTLIVSIVMLLLGLQMMEVKWAKKIKISLPKFLTRKISNNENISGKFMPFVTGFGTFFLPCGMTLIVQSVALSSGSFLTGASIMLSFALGTLVILGIISFGGVLLNSRPDITYKFNLIAGIIVIILALVNINGQLNVLGLPSMSSIGQSKGVTTDIAQIVDNEQTINLVAKGFNYIPTSSTTLKNGVKTKMVIDNQGIEGCGVYVAAKGLFDGYKELVRGDNIIEFVPRTGVYKLTCSMGMVPPVTISVVE